ncbi:general secretion pathway protein GspN [Luteimonas sp. MC1825]|uniref:general secretion pathway protein GspN n=1 Tax=Luteimonas sp. MC1825 TaxID=2761107 RepID=UPI0016146795|nr:general secretion pathway protein GspN [Luteimonas sp. MC1825]MBB6600052.1 general secretion pathway protein GspN [Luteimonas sp. MC1825]QOC87754.1 general secretion pathway protein GspN [Luteimonas sp. MC1825]
MHAENAGARTWLLGGVALWALTLWALGLFGLGGRIERLPPDPTLVQALPAVVEPGEDRLGELPLYAAIGDRPLFTTDRRPQPFFINPEGEEEPVAFEFVLTSVLLTPGLEMAIVQPGGGGESVRLRVGEAPEAAPGWRLASVAARSAVFSGPEGDRSLELRVFDGVGGQAPTVSAAPQPPVAASPASGGAVPPVAGPGPGNRPVVVTTSSSPAPTEVTVPQAGQPAGAAPAPEPGVQTPDAQVEAIRQRIEARRARLRQQAQDGTPPAQTP